MNAHNNNNDPFEDVFRDRFADFESEPDTQLWQKIEPKLPVDSTRKFPYWQISTIAILLLAGLWMYREKYSDDIVIKSDEFQTENANPPLSVSPQTTKTNNSTTSSLSVSSQTTQSKNTTKKSDEKINIAKLPNRSLQDDKVSFGVNENDKITNGNVENKMYHGIVSRESESSVLITSHEMQSRDTFNSQTYAVQSIETTDNNFSKNNTSSLNLFLDNNSNKKQVINTDNSSVSSVFSNKENVSVLSKNFLTSLDSKSYSLLKNQFKTPKLKFVAAPKKDDYYKERKPLEIYASVMPLLNYYTITPNGNDANYVHSIAVNNDEDRLGFYTQAGLVFTLSDRFKLRTGLTFTRTNHSINYQIRTDSLIIQPSDRQGVDVSFEEKKANYSQVANYLGTKIEVQYIFLEGEALTHYLNVGLEGAYRLNGGKQFNGFANFAYGVTRQIGDNAYLFVEPTFSYSLNQQSDNNSFLLVKPNKIGFNIGVNFKIK
jgi:hypothetical protein